jgi:hypothetical protein
MENSKAQMLSVGLAAMSTNRPVEAAIDTPNVPYSGVTRMYLMGPAGGGTKVAFNQSIIGMPTSGKTLDPIDISAFAKIRFSVTVNGSGSIQFLLLSGTGSPSFPSAYALDDFSVGVSSSLTRTYDVAGAKLIVHQMTPESNQAIIGVFGN